MMEKGDFTASARLLWIAALAVVIGCVCAVVAVVLLRAIYFFTNLFFYQTVSLELATPADNHLGLWVILVPALGGLVVGLMARFGSDRIRGHGIPEAIEAILFSSSRMQPKVAVLKPLSSAISIGSGGPFGAEGPIIMTGGAFGSIIAQVFHLTGAERKTLLVAGAAGGMSATFGTPVAAVLIAVELLLFEWKPRSLVPVAVASWMAALLRPFLMPDLGNPLFAVRLHSLPLGLDQLLAAVPVGLIAGLVSLALTAAVYGMEDFFHRLPIHWMWWPALGGLVVGVGGYFQPHALGVGYDLISDMLKGQILWAVLPLMLVKAWIWSTSLGSGTSGGVLAPLLIVGGAVGVLEAGFLPGNDVPLWALASMAAVLGGTMRAPLTGTVFGLELTHDMNALPALLIASVLSYTVTVLLMKRSILTEKVARRGYHVSQEYAVDPLERISIGEIMTTDLVTIPASLPVKKLVQQYLVAGTHKKHQGYPVVDAGGKLVGVITRTDLLDEWLGATLKGGDGKDLSALDLIIAYDLIRREPIVAYPWEACRTAAERMAAAGVGRLAVVDPGDSRKLLGLVTRSDLLKPRAQALEEEVRRERFLAARRREAGDGEGPEEAEAPANGPAADAEKAPPGAV